MLRSEGDRTVGSFDRTAGVLVATPSTSREQLGFRERSIGVVLNQLIGKNWAVGASSERIESHIAEAAALLARYAA